ncbi:MAG: alanine racemase domain protein [Gammaproteobacteria bacterium]|jgi:pyridoxal phosphate enzyme (YggS family)|nr:alanine racemase domain protein [Gammaproteobacteria bacterium]
MLKDNYQKLCCHIAELSVQSPVREPVKILAVSKYASVEAVREIAAAGQKDFGENYWQSAKAKMQMLADLPLVWHFIGSLQSNKCMEIAQYFSWVHSVAKTKHVALLAKARENLPPLQICLQVNFSHDTRKYGVLPEDVLMLAKEVLKYPSLNLRGLMVLPKPGETKDFIQLAKLRNEIEQSLAIELPTLSMGMSDDYEVAIKAGATIVRIGSKIFN